MRCKGSNVPLYFSTVCCTAMENGYIWSWGAVVPDMSFRVQSYVWWPLALVLLKTSWEFKIFCGNTGILVSGLSTVVKAIERWWTCRQWSMQWDRPSSDFFFNPEGPECGQSLCQEGFSRVIWNKGMRRLWWSMTKLHPVPWFITGGFLSMMFSKVFVPDFGVHFPTLFPLLRQSSTAGELSIETREADFQAHSGKELQTPLHITQNIWDMCVKYSKVHFNPANDMGSCRQRCMSPGDELLPQLRCDILYLGDNGVACRCIWLLLAPGLHPKNGTNKACFREDLFCTLLCLGFWVQSGVYWV